MKRLLDNQNSRYFPHIVSGYEATTFAPIYEQLHHVCVFDPFNFYLTPTDCWFVAQIYLNYDDKLSVVEKWTLFSFGLLFIILPLIGNIMQLHHEIQVWITDSYSKYSVQAWMNSYLRVLHFMTIICGSSFAAVDICNSNIFHLSLFNMGLNKRQRAIFKNQRILSVVLLENIPQLILQAFYVILSQESNISPVTIIAMIFSIISIVLSAFNYTLSSLLIKCEAITFVQMDIESQQLGNMQSKIFGKIIVHQRKPICRQLSKIIDIDKKLIEILMPIQTNTGAKLVFFIRNNSHDQNLGSNIVDTIRNALDSGELAQVKFLSWIEYTQLQYFNIYIILLDVFYCLAT